jgi:hypothetical protein
MSWDYIPVIDLQISEDGGLGLEGVSGVSFTDPGLLSARHRQTRICVDLTVILRKICRDERCADGTAPVSLPACLEPASSTALRANDQWHFSASTTPPSAAQQISLILAFKFQRQSTDVSLIPEPSTSPDLAQGQSLSIVVHRHTPGLTMSSFDVSVVSAGRVASACLAVCASALVYLVVKGYHARRVFYRLRQQGMV